MSTRPEKHPGQQWDVAGSQLRRLLLVKLLLRHPRENMREDLIVLRNRSKKVQWRQIKRRLTIDVHLFLLKNGMLPLWPPGDRPSIHPSSLTQLRERRWNWLGKKIHLFLYVHQIYFPLRRFTTDMQQKSPAVHGRCFKPRAWHGDTDLVCLAQRGEEKK